MSNMLACSLEKVQKLPRNVNNRGSIRLSQQKDFITAI
jgi:hypothetical protein